MGRKTTAYHTPAKEVDVTSFTSTDITSTQNLDYGSIHVQWSGSAIVGEIKVLAKNDANNPNESFYELDLGATVSLSGDSGDHQIVLHEMPFQEMKVTYTHSSGTGTLTIALALASNGG